MLEKTVNISGKEVKFALRLRAAPLSHQVQADIFKDLSSWRNPIKTVAAKMAPHWKSTTWRFSRMWPILWLFM